MIIPGILEKDLNKIESQINSLKGSAPVIQIDVADGNQVDGLTYQNLEDILKIVPDQKFDIHLMVKDPLPYLKDASKLPDRIHGISSQIEIEKDLIKWLRVVRKEGLKAGLSLNPETPIDNLLPFNELFDIIQLMAVNPGAQGGEFNPSIISKIKEAKSTYPDLTIQVDGGINENTLIRVLNAGANNVVIGSAIFNSESPYDRLKNFEGILNKWKKEK